MNANKFDLNKYERSFRYRKVYRVDTDTVLENTIFNDGGDMFPQLVESFKTLAEAKDALEEYGNSITCNGNMVNVIVYAVECYETDEDGEFVEGSDYETDYNNTIDDRPEIMDMLIEDIVGEVEDYIEMAAAAYNAYKPEYEYSQEDLEDLAEEYMETYAEDLRAWETADSLKNWDESDTARSQSRWETKVDNRYFAEV